MHTAYTDLTLLPQPSPTTDSATMSTSPPRSASPALVEPAIYRIIFIPELARLVCEMLRTTLDKPLARASLFAVALTCRTLLVPALENLWKSIEGIANLLKTLPQSTWKYENIPVVPESGIYLTSAGPIDIQDCDRLCYYNRFVHSIQFPQKTTERIDPNFFVILEGVLGQRNILPCLQKISWDWGDPFPVITHFLPPSLVLLTFHWQPQDGTVNIAPVDQLLRFLASNCPNLETIILRFSASHMRRRDYEAMASISGTLKDIPSLTRLVYPRVSTDVYLHLASKSRPDLKMLMIGNVDNIDWNVVRRAHPLKDAFSGLGYLFVSEGPVSSTLGLLRTSDAPIKYFRARFTEVLTGRKCDLLLKTLRSNTRTGTLLQLELFNKIKPRRLSQLSIADIEVEPITWSHLSIVLEFTHLRILSIDSTQGYDLTNEDIHTLCAGIPHIEVLSLISKGVSFQDEKPKLTLGCLHYFAFHCPRLTELGLTFNAREASSTKLPSQWSRCINRSLASLYVERSPVERPAAVGAHLSTLFPCLSKLKWQEHSNVEAGWRRVGHFMDMMLERKIELSAMPAPS